MKTMHLLIALLLCFAPAAPAAECKDTASYAKARAIVEDLNRIVAPNGIQEAYATRIGGVEQWINVRGQDKANPIVLFAHGGPAAPLIPEMWQYQRPLEEYFTVVNWDQRGAGKTFASHDPNAYADTLKID
ncbi:MAG: alpha/beta hydrolase, partial [Lysobacter sp.]|nr:alpha/beta hydrolase [Lysobacter sp.]